jgi:hypothetical protein
MLFAEIPRRRRHDRPLRHHQLPPRFNRAPDIILTDEIERGLAGRSRGV